MARTYNLFVSHAWSYSEAYEAVINLLNSSSSLSWRNHSVPTYRPLVPAGQTLSRAKLLDELRDQIRGTHAVVVIGGMYVAHSDWIQAEIDIAVAWGKPIIGLRPRGAERTPLALTSAASEMVNWNTNSIVSAIARNALSLS